MIQEFEVATPAEGFVNISRRVAEAVKAAGVRDGICQVFVPHTTAGITINENADPDVVTDMLDGLRHMVPSLAYRHSEGNSPAHIKASLLGSSVTAPVAGGKLYLGTWQGIYLCEFDGPRRRTVCVNVVGG
jgi:secondary thiamine-phosphate synthase enzyme